MKRNRTRWAIIAWIGLCIAAGEPAKGQPTFSIDWQSPSVGIPNSFTALPISPMDILTAPLPGPFGPNPPALGPLPPPGTFIPGGPPGIGLGIGTYPFGEVDALSYGTEPILTPLTPDIWQFSVDEFAAGIFGTPLPPAVWTEGAFGATEASADVFMSLPFPMAAGGVLCPPPGGVIVPGGNTGIMDGNGLPVPSAFVYPGTGLIEPNFPIPGLPDLGDNLDAVDMDSTMGAAGLVYYSLDSGFPDPVEFAPGLASAAANGFVGGDVLVSAIGGPPALYAPAIALGLDLAGPDTDDLDALVLAESGDGIYTPSAIPYDWAAAGSITDMLLFSVRRGSAIIGALDALCGAPIEEGDILTVTAGGVGIFRAAEWLGLATARSGFPTFIPGIGDELDALDVIPEPGTTTFLAMSSLVFLVRRRK
jgi:hypothetical protein